MNDLTIIQQNGGAYIDSREVAEVIGKRHHNLLRDINGYIKTMSGIGAIKIDYSDFFVPSTYQSEQNKEMPCFLLSKMGCEMVANKLTGEKGVLFTAAYVSKFNEMERRERAELEALLEIPTPRLGEINACARIVVKGMKSLGVSAEQIMRFIKETYEPFGISVDFDIESVSETAPRWYRAGEIAEKAGMYSLYGRPHAQATACLLNEIIFIGAEHKRVVEETYNGYAGVCVLYDDYALMSVMQWLVDNGLPDEIYGDERTYHVQYHIE